MAGRSLDKLEKIRKVARALGFECRFSGNFRRVVRGFSVKVRASGNFNELRDWSCVAKKAPSVLAPLSLSVPGHL